MGITPTIETANLSMADSLILMVLALVVFGPRRLPKIGRQIGKLMYEFRKASNDFKFQMEEELRNAEEADRRKREEEERRRALAAAPPAQIEAAPKAQNSSETAAVEGAATGLAGAETLASSDGNSASENPPEQRDETTGLRVQPPATGAPVPANGPANRALSAAQAQAAPAQEAAHLTAAPGAQETAVPVAVETPSGTESAERHA